jgi:hypothetical protein
LGPALCRPAGEAALQAITAPPFGKQNVSHFGLENENRANVGLDSACFATEAELSIDGSLDQVAGI